MSEKPDWISICGVCGQDFADDERFVEHLEDAHDLPPPPF